MAKKYKCRVEYLESTGTQWIDTGVNVDTSTDEIKLYFQLTETQNYKWLFGEYDNNARIGLGSGDGTDKRNFLYQQSATKISDTQMYDSQHLFEINSNGGFLNGTKIRDYLSFTSTATIYLFNLNIESASDYRCKGKIWGYRHKRNGALILDLIPVLDLSDKPAMYDQVSGKLFYNKGTGEFTYGRQIIPVEYLESTGEQYIDTGVTSNLNTVVEMDLNVVSYSTNNTATFFGGLTSNIGISTNISKMNTDRYSRFGTKYATIKNLDIEGIKSTITIDKNAFVINGQSYVVGETSSFNGPNMCLFKVAGVASGYNTTTDIYSCQLWDNGTLVRDFIPCIDENLIPFMFDKVSNTVYLNSGTGQFKVGPNVEKAWGGKKLRKKLALALANLKKKRRYYCEVEFLESTGTQYIDTGLKGKNNLDFDYKCIFTNLDGTAQCVGGNWSGADTSTVSFYFGLIRTNGNFAYHYDGTKSPVVVMNTTVQGTPYIIKGHMWVGEQYMVINGTKSSVGTIASTFTSSLNMYLFGINNNGLSNPVYMKLYYCKIYDNGVLVRDMIPVLDWDMKPCMYDKVSGEMFYNVGTGDFTAGREIHPVEYLESTGTQYIDTDTTFQVTDEVYFKGALLTRSNDKFVLSAQPWNTNNNRYSPLGYYANKLICAFGNIGTPGSYYTPELNDSDVHTITYKNKVFTMEDTGAIHDCSSATFGAETGKIKFFYGYNAPSVARIDAYKQWRDGELICDFIPAIDENDTYFMFDKVSHTCYNNAGSGSFIGPTVQKDENGKIIENEYE